MTRDMRKAEVILLSEDAPKMLNVTLVSYNRERRPLHSLLWAWTRKESETAQFSELRTILVPPDLEAGREDGTLPVFTIMVLIAQTYVPEIRRKPR